jgi:hypothetical protein
MRIIPKTASQRLAFARVHVPLWAEDPAAIGLTAEEVAEVDAALVDAAEARDRAESLRQQAVAATLAAGTRDQELARALADAIARIKLAAREAGVQAVDIFARAQIPVPGVQQGNHDVLPTPASAEVRVSGAGQAALTWTTGAGGARGRRLGRQGFARLDVHYTVERYPLSAGRVQSGPSTIIGVTSAPRFVDPAPLPGASAYLIRAVRGDRVGVDAAMATLLLPDHEKNTRTIAGEKLHRAG